MIEFIIPQNLPVRAVEITEPNGRPSDRLLHEIADWNAGVRSGTSMADLAYMEKSPQSATSVDLAALEAERAELKQQQELFVNATAELQRTTKAVQHRLDEVLLDVQEAVVELAETIATKLVFEEVQEGRFPIANLVHEVLSRLETESNAVIHLHPADLEVIQKLPAIDSVSQGRTVSYVADSNLNRGDCSAKAGEISVIYNLRRQVEEIRRQLLSTVGGHAET